MSEDERDEAAVNEFLMRLAADREAGQEHELTHYLELFPGFEDAITFEWNAIHLAEIEDEAPSEERIGPYRILEELGRGGQGIVYRASDTRLPRVVALKVLRSPVLLAHDSVLARFRREADALSRLDHPNISSVIDVGREGDVAYLAMRFIPGRTLSAMLQEKRREFIANAESSSGSGRSSRQTIKERVALIETCARAVHAAHRAGIIHRDLKPANVMIGEDDQPVLLDFGLAHDTEETSLLTGTGDVLGTPAYMSPEQVEGKRVGVATDVWSLGVMLFEALTLHHPFEATVGQETPSTHAPRTREQLFSAIRLQPPLDPRRFDRGIPRDLKVVIEAAIDKDPARRYASAEDFANDLRRILEDRPVTARRISPFTRGARWAQRHPARAAAILLTAIALPVIGFLAATIQENRKDVLAARAERRIVEYEDTVTEGFWESEHGDKAEGLVLLQRATEQNPERPEAWIGLALGHALRARHAEARDAFRKLEPLLPDPGALQLLSEELSDLESGAPPSCATEAADPITQTGWFVRGVVIMNVAHRMTIMPEALSKDARRAFLNAILGSRRANKVFHHSLAHATGHLRAHAIDPAESLALSRALITFWPDDVSTNQMAAYVLVHTNPDEAIRCYERLMELAPRVGRATRWLPTTIGDLVKKKDPERARKLYHQTLRDYGEHPMTLRRLGRLALEQGRRDEATQWAQRALKSTRAISERRMIAALLCEIGQLDQGLQLYREILAKRPWDWQLRYELAVALHTANKLDECDRLLDEILALGPKGGVSPWVLSESHNFKCMDHLEAGRIDAARSEARKGVAADPDNLNNLPFLAALVLDTNPLEARQLIQHALTLSETDNRPIARARTLLLAGILKSRTQGEDPTQTWAALDAHLATIPDEVHGTLDVLRPLKNTAPYRRRLLEALLKAHPNHEPTLFKLASLLTPTDPNRALTLFQTANTLSQNPRSLFQIAALQMQLGRTDLCIETSHQALALDPKSPHGWCNLGINLHYSGRPKEGIEALLKGKAIADTIRHYDPPIPQWLAAAQRSQKTLEALQPKLETLLQTKDLSPHRSDAIRLATTLTQQNFPARSYALWSRLRVMDPTIEQTHARSIAAAAIRLSRCPTGLEGTPTDPAALRKDALKLTQQAFEGMKKQHEAGDLDQKTLAARASFWLKDTYSFWSVRNANAMAQFGDEEEVKAWWGLWSWAEKAAGVSPEK